MPNYPVVEDGSPLFGGPVPVTTSADVLAVLPREIVNVSVAPTRDAIVAMLTTLHREYQKASAYAAAQVDPTRATGIYLDGTGEDRSVPRAAAISDSAYRTAIFATANTVTATTILAQINALLAPITTIKAQAADATLDAMFIPDGIGVMNQVFVQAPASYPDRLYPNDAYNTTGFNRPNSLTGGFVVFDSQGTRTFFIRIPDLTGTDTLSMFLYDGNENADEFVLNVNNVDNPRAFGFQSTASSVYAQIVAVVTSIKAQGYRFIILVDPTLTA